MAGVVLLVLNLGTVTYMRQIEPTNAPLTALIADAKPTRTAIESATTADEEIAVACSATSPPADRASAAAAPDLLPLESLAPLSAAPQVLPAEYDLIEPDAALTEETLLGEISFSKQMNEAFEAVDPGRIFEEGYYTVFATFSYEGMTDGLAWSWIWRYNGEVISGGNERWVYGDEGPGYIYLEPEDGFIPGEYDLQIWVNGELLTDAQMFLTATVAANQ